VKLLSAILFLTLATTVALGQDSANPPAAQTAPPAAQTPPAQTPAAGAPAPAQAPVPSSFGTPEEVAHRYVDMWNTGKFDNIHATIAAPAIIVSHGNRIFLTPELLEKVITNWRKSMPDLTFTIEDTLVQGDKVAMRLSFTGTYKERLFPGTQVPDPANPRQVRATEMLMFHLKNGKINQIWEEYDELRMHIMMGGSWHTDTELEAATKKSKSSAKP